MRRSYLVLSAEKIHDSTFNSFIGSCCNLSLLVSEEFLKKGQHYEQSHVALNCDFSAEGLKDLLDSLKKGQSTTGSDCLVMRVLKSESVLSDSSAEARILEFMSNVDQASGALLYGLLIGSEGKPVEEAGSVADLDAMTVNTDEIILSRFFNPQLLEFTGVTKFPGNFDSPSHFTLVSSYFRRVIIH